MTLKEMKIKTFSLIEEYYPNLENLAEDEDVINKINGVINQIQMDLMKYRKISSSEIISISKNDLKTIELKDYLDNFYQVAKILFDKDVDYNMPIDGFLQLPDDYEGEFTIFYYRYPTLAKTVFENETEIKKEDEKYTFELDTVLLEIMPYGIAADLLKMDMISSYGKYFYERYLEMKNSIDTRTNIGMITISGGVDI